MPQYEFRCPAMHFHVRLRRAENRDDPAPCPQCHEPTVRLFPLPHIEPSGVYSYEPNLGSADDFERKQANVGKVVDK